LKGDSNLRNFSTMSLRPDFSPDPNAALSFFNNSSQAVNIGPGNDIPNDGNFRYKLAGLTSFDIDNTFFPP